MNTPSNSASAPVVAFVILAPSARGFRNCLIGEGATEREAWLDAYGVPKKPKHARSAWCEGVTQSELDTLREGVHSH
jgi:hypothetical protein